VSLGLRHPIPGRLRITAIRKISARCESALMLLIGTLIYLKQTNTVFLYFFAWDEKKKLETEDMFHLDRAKEMQDSLKIESEQGEDNSELGLFVLTVGLQ
jgi:hypothetical protein